MKTIKAQKIGIKVIDYLKDQPTGKVHSVFSRAINLITAGDIILTILYADNHPCVIRLNQYNFPAKIIKQNETYNYENQMIFFNRFKISLKKTTIYSQKKSLSLPASSGYIRNNIETINNYLSRNKVIDKATSTDFISRIDAQAHNIIQHVNYNPSRLSSVIHPVIGYGPGLTPAGDDFISGLFCTLFLYSDCLQKYIPSAKEINKYNTVSLAKQQLLFSSQGYCLQRIYNIIETTPQAPVTPVLIDKVLAIGATSGFAWLKGILLAFKMLLDVN